MPDGREQGSQRVGRVGIVVNHQYAQWRHGALAASGILLGNRAGLAAAAAQWQPDREGAALVGSRAAGGNRAAMQLDEPSHQRQPYAQPALGAVLAGADLG